MLLTELLPSLKTSLYAIGYADVGNWWNYKNVNSPFTRILYIKNGNALISFDSQDFPVSAGDVIAIPPFTPVDYRCETECGHYYILFAAVLTMNIELFSLLSSHWIQPATSLTENYIKRLTQLNPGIELKIFDPKKKNYRENIFKTVEHKNMLPKHLLETDGIMRMLIAPFLGNIHHSKTAKKDYTVKRLVKVLNYIDRNIDQPILLQDMAEQISVHPNYFSDLFVKHIGERPVAYLTRKRIEKVQFLLATTNRPVKDIALTSGFQDTDYFYRVFKKKVQLTPSQYRKNIWESH